jgi:cytoskeletal protein RodZ
MQQSRGQKILYFAVFLVLVGFLAFAVLSSRDTKKTSTVVKAPVKVHTVTPAASASSQQSSSSSSSTATPSQAAAGVNNAQLASTGPTETVTLFVVTVAGGTAAAQLYQRRRARSPSI